MDRWRWTRSLATLLVGVLMAACGTASEGTPSASRPSHAQVDTGSSPLEPEGLEAPPPVTIRYGDKAAELHAWTYCYGNGCADGAPPEDPIDVGSPDEVVIEFPLDDWSFGATFTPSNDRCGRNIDARAESLGDGRFVLHPAGYADSYDVTLFGRGDGDLFVTFRWTTPTDGPLPVPKARLAVLADHDGRLDSYGVELEITNLERDPKKASATITVEAANGRSVSFDAKRSRTRCWPEGTLYWDGPDDEGLAVAALGECPCTYLVELELDGEHYRARAEWPRDEIKGNEPSARLDFVPPLPALE